MADGLANIRTPQAVSDRDDMKPFPTTDGGFTMNEFGSKAVGSLFKNPGCHPHIRTPSGLGSETIGYRLCDPVVINTSEASSQGVRR